MNKDHKPQPQESESKETWERFERAVDVVIKAKPKHRPAKERPASKGRVRKGR